MTDLRAPEEATMREQGTPSLDNRWAEQCLNCERALHGPFCSHCGQRAVPPHPTVRELAGDAVSEVSGWDGKFAETLKFLLSKPGELTRQWLDGRRARFISPIRLYLTASVVFFLSQAAAPDIDGKGKAEEPVAQRNAPERVAAATTKSVRDSKTLTPAERDSALASVAKAPRVMRPMLRRMIADPDGWEASLRSLVPRMFFGLLPLYAGIVAIFYRRRHFPEHLYFAIHLHAFVFVAMTFVEAAKFTYQPTVSKAVGIAAMGWIVLYSLLSLRNVYGGSWVGTLLKAIGIMTLYFMVLIPAFTLTIYLAAFV